MGIWQALDQHMDTATGFSVPQRNARGRIVRMGPVLDAVLGAHDYPPAIAALLAEALTLTVLLGAMLKSDSGQLTMQAQTSAAENSGVVRLLVCDYRAGDVRGYVQFDAERLALMGAHPSLFALFGKAYLAITFDQPVPGKDTPERYQGIVPLDGVSLAAAAEQYFDQSEQIPSLVRIAAAEFDGGWHAGGLLLQYLPEGEVGRERLHVRKDWPDWELVETLGRSVKDAELLDETLPPTDLIWRLFHDAGEVRTTGTAPLARGCRCDPAHIADVLSRFPESERDEMRGPNGQINVDCAFCSRVFALPG